MPGYAQTLASCHTAGAAVTGTGITTLLHGSGLFTLPGGSLNEGDELEVCASGQMNTVVTTPGTTTFTLKFGSVSVFASQAIALNIVAQTNAWWELVLRSVVRSVGNGTQATLLTTGKFTSRASLNAPAVGTTNGVGTVPLPDTAPAVGTGFDSTVSNLIDLQVTNSVAGSITCMRYKLRHEIWRP
jgi:hypothetical protein